MLSLPVVPTYPCRPDVREPEGDRSPRSTDGEPDRAVSLQEILRLDAQQELSRLDRDQLAQLAAVLLEAMPNSYRWSDVASIRDGQHAPAEPARLQRP